MAFATTYVTETIGPMEVVTEVLKTDADGRVRLQGPYCLPVVVVIRGGAGVTLQPETLRTSYEVIATSSEGITLQRMYGQPDERYLGWSRKHGHCG